MLEHKVLVEFDTVSDVNKATIVKAKTTTPSVMTKP